MALEAGLHHGPVGWFLPAVVRDGVVTIHTTRAHFTQVQLVVNPYVHLIELEGRFTVNHVSMAPKTVDFQLSSIRREEPMAPGRESPVLRVALDTDDARGMNLGLALKVRPLVFVARQAELPVFGRVARQCEHENSAPRGYHRGC